MLAVLAPILGPILDKALGALLPDQAKRQEIIMSVFGQLQASDLAQIGVNANEAKSDSIFVAGWRPFIGWVCGFALAYTYILVPFISFGFQVSGKPLPKLPALDANLWELMFGMLGMAGLRSFEKIKGIVK